MLAGKETPIADLPTRQTLLIRLKERHDDSSWEEFVHYYRRFIFAIIIEMGVNHADQDDLGQQVLVKLWKNLPGFDYTPNRGRFRSWLATVTRNTVRNHLKSSLKKELRFTDDEQRLATVTEKDSQFDKMVELEWQRHIARLAWENIEPRLSETVRRVFTAFDELQGDIKATATREKVAENTVYVYTKRVRKQLYREILRLEGELG